MKQEVLAWLRTATPKDLDEIMTEVVRLKRKNPDWEIDYMCWKKGDLKEKREVLIFATKVLAREENSLRYKNTDSAL